MTQLHQNLPDNWWRTALTLTGALVECGVEHQAKTLSKLIFTLLNTDDSNTVNVRVLISPFLPKMTSKVRVHLFTRFQTKLFPNFVCEKEECILCGSASCIRVITVSPPVLDVLIGSHRIT